MESTLRSVGLCLGIRLIRIYARRKGGKEGGRKKRKAFCELEDEGTKEGRKEAKVDRRFSSFLLSSSSSSLFFLLLCVCVCVHARPLPAIRTPLHSTPLREPSGRVAFLPSSFSLFGVCVSVRVCESECGGGGGEEEQTLYQSRGCCMRKGRKSNKEQKELS